MRIILCALAAAIAASVRAQAPDPQRMEAIWIAASNRMGRQADVWFNDGDFPRSIQLLRIMVALDPRDYETATNLGWLLESTEAWDQALATYVAFRHNNRGHPDGPYPEAFFYYMKRMYAKVPALLEPTLSMNPHPNTYRILAHAYDRLGMLKESRRVWEQFVARHPTDETAKMNLRKIERKLTEPPPKERGKPR